MSRASVARRSKRDQRVLRYMLRRRQCMVFCLINMGLMMLFVALGVGLFFGYRHFHEIRVTDDNEIETLEAMRDKWTFAQCEYKENNKFNTDACSAFLGPLAIIYRERQWLSTQDIDDNEFNCIDLVETLPCQEDVKLKRPILPKPVDTATLCRGVEQYSWEYTHDQVFVPLFSNLTSHLDSTMFGGELFVMCPKCNATNHNGNGQDYSFGHTDHLTTEQKGWPWYVSTCTPSIDTEGHSHNRNYFSS